MLVSYNDVIYILEDAKGRFAYGVDDLGIELHCPLNCLSEKLEPLGFLRINSFTLVNTRFVVGKKGKRLILLKGGSIHKVSRSIWKHFAGMPT